MAGFGRELLGYLWESTGLSNARFLCVFSLVFPVNGVSEAPYHYLLIIQIAGVL